MKKFVALMLSLVLLIGCIGSAEVYTIKADVNYMGMPSSAVINAGYDEDGCSVLSAAIKAMVTGMGVEASLMLQAGEDAITISDVENTYTITAAALEAAVTAVMEELGIQSADASETEASQVSGIGSYLSAILPILASITKDDIELVYNVAMYEVNRLMSIAFALGIVNISENGDLTISADIDTVIALAGNYLSSLAADEMIIPYVAQNHFWTEYGMPEAAAVQAYLAQMGEYILSMNSAMFGISGELYLEATAAGTVSVKLSAGAGENAFAAAFDYNAEGVAMSYEASINGQYVAYAYYTDLATTLTISETVGENGYTLTLTLNEDGTVSVQLGAGVLGMTVAVDAVIDLMNYAFIANVNYNGMEFNVTGAPTFTEVGIEYNVVLTVGENSITYTIGYSAMMTEAGSVMYIIYAAKGEENYVLSVEVAGYEAVVNAYYNDNLVFSAQGGVVMTAENSGYVYVVYQGITYTLSATVEESENGASVALSLDCPMGEQSMNIGTANIVATVSEEAFAHTAGYELSAEELKAMIYSVISAYAGM